VTVEVVFETHSPSVDNERGIATDWLQGRLSREGRRLAAELGLRRRDDGIGHVYKSDLHHAVETAAIAFADTAIPVHLDARLRECNYGSMNGMPVSTLISERRLRLDRPFPDGESWRQAGHRVGGLLRDLANEHDGERVLLTGHVATRWALDHFVNGNSLEELAEAPFQWQEGWVYMLDPIVFEGHF
jgi:2,3-bisphosphoglycerate-dependent phosphoglycerate mutase